MKLIKLLLFTKWPRSYKHYTLMKGTIQFQNTVRYSILNLYIDI